MNAFSTLMLCLEKAYVGSRNQLICLWKSTQLLTKRNRMRKTTWINAPLKMSCFCSSIKWHDASIIVIVIDYRCKTLLNDSRSHIGANKKLMIGSSWLMERELDQTKERRRHQQLWRLNNNNNKNNSKEVWHDPMDCFENTWHLRYKEVS